MKKFLPQVLNIIVWSALYELAVNALVPLAVTSCVAVAVSVLVQQTSPCFEDKSLVDLKRI